jgi:hypothetical protein
LFEKRGEQVEESPLTLVEMLSRDHGATPLESPSCPPVRGVLLRTLFEWLKVIFCLFNKQVGHRLAASTSPEGRAFLQPRNGWLSSPYSRLGVRSVEAWRTMARRVEVLVS